MISPTSKSDLPAANRSACRPTSLAYVSRINDDLRCINSTTYFQGTVLHESFASNVSCIQILSLPSRKSYQHTVSTDWTILVGQRSEALFVQRPTTAQSTGLVDSPFSNDFFRQMRQLFPHHRTCETKSFKRKVVLVASLQICILSF